MAVDQRGYPRPANSIDIGAVQTLTPQQRFVESLYLDFLHRTGHLNDPNDAGGWVTALNLALPATIVTEGIATSEEALGVAWTGCTTASWAATPTPPAGPVS